MFRIDLVNYVACGFSYLIKPPPPQTSRHQLITSGESAIAALHDDELNAAVVSVCASINYWHRCLAATEVIIACIGVLEVK